MKNICTYFLLLVAVVAFSQKKSNHLANGNREFEKGNYAEAEAHYRAAHAKNPGNSNAYYNLGNSIYKQGAGSEAKYAYAKAIDVAKTKAERHQAYRNLGNVYMDEKNYREAVDTYENALRNNPHDEQTRYNYALAKKMLEKNPPPPPPPPLKEKEKEKNENKRKGDEDRKTDSPQRQGEQKDQAGSEGDIKKQQDKQGDNKEGRTGKGNRDNMPATQSPSKQRMKNILDAVDNEEKKVMDRVNSKNSKGSPVKHEKDW